MRKLLSFAILLSLPAACFAQKKSDPVFFSHTGSFFSATGKWKANSGKPGDEVAFKHAVEIDCFKGDACMEATASIVEGEPSIGVSYYKIVRWDANGLVAESDAPICTTNQIIVNFQDKSVMAIDAPKVKVSESCKHFQAPEHTQTYTLMIN